MEKEKETKMLGYYVEIYNCAEMVFCEIFHDFTDFFNTVGKFIEENQHRYYSLTCMVKFYKVEDNENE